LPHKHFCKVSLLLVLSFGVGLAAAELIVRIWDKINREPATAEKTIYNYLSFDKGGMFQIEPSVSGLHIGFDDRPILVKINSLGFRGPELRKSPELRVVFVGDSIVFDGGVEQEETFESLIESYFQKDGVDLEVVNSGAADVGIDQYLIQMERGRLRELKPQVIVIGLYLNDSRPPQGFLGEKVNDPFLKFIGLPGIKKLALANLWKKAYIVSRTGLEKNLHQRFEWIEDFRSGIWFGDPLAFAEMVKKARFDWGAAWEDSYDQTVFPAILKIRDLAQGLGAKLVVVMFPVSMQVYARFNNSFLDLPQRNFAVYAEKNGISFLDLLPRLRERSREKLFADQCHLNRRGNKAVAEIVYPFLAQELGYLSPGSKSGKKPGNKITGSSALLISSPRT